jgi:hypothetical protein
LPQLGQHRDEDPAPQGDCVQRDAQRIARTQLFKCQLQRGGPVRRAASPFLRPLRMSSFAIAPRLQVKAGNGAN